MPATKKRETPKQALKRIDAHLRRLTRGLDGQTHATRHQTLAKADVWIDERLRVMKDTDASTPHP